MELVKAEVEWRFGIQSDSWVWGQFGLRVGSSFIGDWEDSTALSIVFGWIEDFLINPVDRRLENTELVSAEQLFASLYDPFRVRKVTRLEPIFSVDTAISRFDITYLGMSSFDNWAVLLIDCSEFQRLAWADLRKCVVQEAKLPPGEIQRVFTIALKQYKNRAFVTQTSESIDEGLDVPSFSE